MASLCGFIDLGGSPTINGNASGCANIPEVTAACATVSIDEVQSQPFAVVIDHTSGWVSVHSTAPGNITVFDATGRQLLQQRSTGQTTRIDPHQSEQRCLRHPSESARWKSDRHARVSLVR